MYLLPKMGPENLNQGDLERGNLAVQEDTGQIQLHLETDVDICSVNGLQQKSVYRTIVFMGRLTERQRPQRSYPRRDCPRGCCPIGDNLSRANPTGDAPRGGHPTGGHPTGSCPTGGCPTGGCLTGGCPTVGCPTGGSPTGGSPIVGCPIVGCPRGDYTKENYPERRGGGKTRELTGDHHKVNRRFGIWLRPDR